MAPCFAPPNSLRNLSPRAPPNDPAASPHFSRASFFGAPQSFLRFASASRGAASRRRRWRGRSRRLAPVVGGAVAPRQGREGDRGALLQPHALERRQRCRRAVEKRALRRAQVLNQYTAAGVDGEARVAPRARRVFERYVAGVRVSAQAMGPLRQIDRFDQCVAVVDVEARPGSLRCGLWRGGWRAGWASVEARHRCDAQAYESTNCA